MTKLSRRELGSKQLGYYINDLWSAFTLMDSKEDIRSLFRDLFTRTEYKMFAKRLQIARLLLKGETYETIRDVMKVTDTTIANVNNILASKGEGFRKADEKLSKIALDILNKKSKYYADPITRKFNRQIFDPPSLVKESIKNVSKKIAQHQKYKSAKTSLSL